MLANRRNLQSHFKKLHPGKPVGAKGQTSIAFEPNCKRVPDEISDSGGASSSSADSLACHSQTDTDIETHLHDPQLPDPKPPDISTLPTAESRTIDSFSQNKCIELLKKMKLCPTPSGSNEHTTVQKLATSNPDNLDDPSQLVIDRIRICRSLKEFEQLLNDELVID